ncbi:exported protein of unknown function [Blastococcus saxobsidens DD2]|uniref:Uncharacterized protein n=1 Tax=Blastococcus saxobsidens (strain DD2) TaxID=1146883 RepID=H6RRK3_BLASD|nr:exported protein of unknown function [Blastococcus saxobsidens DD2]
MRTHPGRVTVAHLAGMWLTGRAIRLHQRCADRWRQRKPVWVLRLRRARRAILLAAILTVLVLLAAQEGGGRPNMTSGVQASQPASSESTEDPGARHLLPWDVAVPSLPEAASTISWPRVGFQPLLDLAGRSPVADAGGQSTAAPDGSRSPALGGVVTVVIVGAAGLAVASIGVFRWLGRPRRLDAPSGTEPAEQSNAPQAAGPGSTPPADNEENADAALVPTPPSPPAHPAPSQDGPHPIDTVGTSADGESIAPPAAPSPATDDPAPKPQAMDAEEWAAEDSVDCPPAGPHPAAARHRSTPTTADPAPRRDLQKSSSRVVLFTATKWDSQ